MGRFLGTNISGETDEVQMQGRGPSPISISVRFPTGRHPVWRRNRRTSATSVGGVLFD
jgi:hypothetical protein